MRVLMFLILFGVVPHLLGLSAEAKSAVRIGLIQPETGPAAYDGQSVINGARLAESEINEKGGVLGGKKIEVLLQDGKVDPSESLNAAERLLDRDEVSALIGAWGSSATLAIMPVVERYEVPLIVETSTAEKITEVGNPWVFRISSHSQIDADVLGPYMVDELGFEKVAFMAANNDFGRAVVSNWTRVLAPQGGRVVMAEYHNPGEVNFAATLTKIRNSDADTIVITSDVTTVSNIIKQSYELGLGGLKRVVTSGNPAEAIINLAGESATDGMLVQNYWVPYAPAPGQEEASQEFAQKYAERFKGRQADKYAVSGYDSVYLIAAAIEEAGSDEPVAIRDALREIKLPALQGVIVFDEQQQARPHQSISKIKDGEPKIILEVGQ